MNKINAQSIALRARDKARSLRTKIAGATAVVAGAMYSGLAMAQSTTLGEAVKTEVEGGKTAVTAILLVLAGVLGLFLLWSMIKRAK
ncbi:hypothetical protein [Lysobacter sp. FW306-1B-D06B]|uniref:hypothetical protein n=1 Tax=Lysobacter sp. FW306-1B-D06B TaxID=3140250 RepID=UPI0031406DD2